jgi:predicted amidohydrolase
MGRLGLVFGEEIGYPEVGRLLARQDVGLIAALCAASEEATVAETRLAAIARAQENQCYVATSFPVGPDYLATDADGAHALLGRSGIYAPPAQTPRYSGALVEMGALSTEGLLTGELTGVALAAGREEYAQKLERVASFVEASAALPPADYASLPLPTASEAEVEDELEVDDRGPAQSD